MFKYVLNLGDGKGYLGEQPNPLSHAIIGDGIQLNYKHFDSKYQILRKFEKPEIYTTDLANACFYDSPAMEISVVQKWYPNAKWEKYCISKVII